MWRALPVKAKILSLMRLIYNQKRTEELQLVICYKPSDYLHEKFRALAKAGFSTVDLVNHAVSPNKWVHPEFFEFSESSLIDIHETFFV